MVTFSSNYRQKQPTRKYWNTGGYDWVILTITAFLCVGGLAFLTSALSTKSEGLFQKEFFHQLVFGVWIGGVSCYILSILDYKLLFKYKNFILLCSILALLFIALFILASGFTGMSYREILSSVSWLPIKPYVANGAMRWISTPLSNFQPSEFVKFSLLVYFSAFLYEIEKKNETPTLLKLKKPIYAMILCSFLIIIQPDLGSILLTSVIIGSALWITKVDLKILFPLGIAVVVFALALSLFSNNYRRDRIDAIFNPSSQKAYHINQVQGAIRNGGVWGKGYGHSEYKQKGLIPEVTTDAIIGIIGEEMGFVFTLMFLSLYLAFFVRGMQIASKAQDNGAKALAVGISVWIVSQAFLNITGITGITPLKGLPLPFVSEGGTSLVINLAIVGVLLNISKQSGQFNQNIPVPAFQFRSAFIKKRKK